MLSADAVVVKCAGPLTANVGVETVMLDPDAGRYFALGTMGSLIWDLIDGPTAVASISAALVQRFEVEPGRCLEETLAFLADLEDAKLIERVT